MSITTSKIKAILESHNCTGSTGADYGPIKHELEDELWRRQAKQDELNNKLFEENYNLYLEHNHMKLTLVTAEYVDLDNHAEIELANAEMSHDDDLPPPIPTEAKMSWLSSIATAKSDLPKNPAPHVETATVVTRANENVWSGLPQGTIVGEARLYRNQVPLTEIMERQERRSNNIHANSSAMIQQSVERRSTGTAYAPNYRFIFARFGSKCEGCDGEINRGELILWYKQRKTVYCSGCEEFRLANAERIARGLSDATTWRNQ